MTAATRKGTLDLSANAITVLERRYLVKDDQGAPVEQPEDLFWRVARTIAEPDGRYGASAKAVEGLAETFFELMATRVWMPNSPTLMNAGRRRSEEHTSELQSPCNLVCRLLLEKKKKKDTNSIN